MQNAESESDQDGWLEVSFDDGGKYAEQSFS